jgi:hypothetical protein
MLTLPPAAFDDSRIDWAFARTNVYWLEGDTVHARRYADSARMAVEAQLTTTPNDPWLVMHHAVALDYLGQHAAAVQEGARAFALARASDVRGHLRPERRLLTPSASQ